MTAYYNEIDPYAAQWLRGLITHGFVPPGDVDERDIRDVRPADLAGYDQHHFFAGIGGWGLALRLAGWPDDRPVWTGSCPCQALSSAARGNNTAPDLWPEWRRLIVSNRPRAIFGEQVAHKDAWLDRICDDMEPLGYEVGAAVLPALSVGQDHSRPRIYFACHADRNSEPGLRVDAEASRVPRAQGVAGKLVPSNGVSNRVAVLRAFGNAIVPALAAEFIIATAYGPSPEVKT